MAQNADPSNQEAQRLAEYLADLNRRVSQGWDKDILDGMIKSWENFNALPEEKKPQIYRLTPAERQFIKEACSILQKRRSQDESRWE
ncbi:hypothetical protein SAMN05421543_10680 [Alicyclobacillus macrosporangiidus]|uniref:Uncharacterized protein n=1 Tax=Alicyclobacillus macrosporangiidus TaxID=392015 RepID=A0A1I7I966_9BACL|nr:hypothetical protein SAMN05421543_10680 [Alicyclobacillus macrosporangiidus]